jgi:hypothetical protein
MLGNLHFLRKLDFEEPALINLTNLGRWFVRLLCYPLLQFFESEVKSKCRFYIAYEAHLPLVNGLQLKLVHKND